MDCIIIPDGIRNSSMRVRAEIVDGAFRLDPMDADQLLLIQHWTRIARNSARTKAFSTWAKFSADAVVGGEARRYHGCFIMEDGNDHVLRWDLWELSGRTGGA